MSSDLAARNILIDEQKTLKISDFGMSRDGIYYTTRTKKVSKNKFTWKIKAKINTRPKGPTAMAQHRSNERQSVFE